jgi:peptidoglycan hydrolase CwlO-like protein
MEAMAAIQERLRNVDVRLQANHDSIATLRGKQAAQDVDIAVMHTELREVREDIRELKQNVEAQMAWVRRGLWIAAGTFLMFVIALAGLVATLAGHG